jgi:hypothetical protein
MFYTKQRRTNWMLIHIDPKESVHEAQNKTALHL